MTKKAKYINQLESLSADQKETIISFFSVNPVYESRIDWNNKSLTYGDFEKVLMSANDSNKKNKEEADCNPEIMFSGYNCRIVNKTDDYIIVVPLDWECAMFMNSFNCGGEGARWCIGFKTNFSYWNRYLSREDTFYFVFFINKHPFFGRKVIFQYSKDDNKSPVLLPYLKVWNANDEEINDGPFIYQLYVSIANDVFALENKETPKKVDLDYSFNNTLRKIEKSNFSDQIVIDALQISFQLIKGDYKKFDINKIEDIYKNLKNIHEKITEAEK